jgi:alkylation response protein AidB-like acyl-CoA dehydrogenase
MEGFPWWSDSQKELAEETEKVTNEILIPICERSALKRKYPWEGMKEIGRRGWFGAIIPEEYEGRRSEWGVTGLCIIMEQISRAGSISSPFGVSIVGAIAQIINHGTEDQKKRWLPKLASGKLLGCITMTEPFAGSDVSAIETTATKDGDFYVLNGKKRYQTGAGAADLYMTYVKTSKDPEDIRMHKHLTALIIEKGMLGFNIEKVNDLLGFDGIYNCYLNFKNVRVPKANRLGEENMGWQVMMKGLNLERIAIAASLLGGMREGLAYSMQHLQRRVQFGKLMESLPTNRFKVADMIANLSMARLSIYYGAYCTDLGIENPVDSALAKIFCTEAAMQNAANAMQLMGGNGLTRAYPVERFFRDVKLAEVAGGTNEILRMMLYSMGTRALAKDIKTPFRSIDPEIKIPVPLENRPKKTEVLSDADLLKVLADDYCVNPGLHMTMEDLKERLHITDDRLNEILLQLEKKGLAALHRDRHGLVSLARITYEGISRANPFEYYKYFPSWVDQKDLF